LEKLFPNKKIKIVKYGNQTPRIKIYSKEIYELFIKVFEFSGNQSLWEVPSTVQKANKKIKGER